MGRYAAVLLLCLAPLFADAQDARRVYRIGVLNEAWSADHPTVEGLKAGLKDLGLEEGRDVRFEIRFTQGKPEALSTAATLSGLLDRSRTSLRPKWPRMAPGS